MSIDIHISNYEEYLYSYVDGELNPEEAAALEAFVAAHPRVRAELDQLLATKLTPEAPVFDSKASLYRQAAAPERNYQTVLLDYLDGELAPAEARALEAFMEEHPALRAELAVWEKTRLQPDPMVTFGDKSTLYRQAERQRVVRMDRRLWWAAAAMLAGSFFLLRNAFRSDEIATAPQPVAIVQPSAQPQPVPSTPSAPVTENAARPALADASVSPLSAAATPAVAARKAPATVAVAPVKDAAPAENQDAAPVASGALMALNTLERPAPRPEAPSVNAGISDAPDGIRQQTAAAKTSIDVQHTASLATAPPPEPPGELIMSVTGNGIESKVLDKVTNVARIFAKKRNK